MMAKLYGTVSSVDGVDGLSAIHRNAPRDRALDGGRPCHEALSGSGPFHEAQDGNGPCHEAPDDIPIVETDDEGGGPETTHTSW